MTSFGWVLPYRSPVITSDDPETLSAKIESDVIGLARRAEGLGFDSLWTCDHVLNIPRAEPLSILAAVSAVTTHATIGTSIYLPFLRHPVHVAHQTATLDQISGGRFRFGVGVGASDITETMAQLDLPPERRGRQLDESLEVITALWNDESVSYDGEYYSLSDASIGFSPSRTPPIYVGSGGWDVVDSFPEPIMNRINAHGDGWVPLKTSPEAYETILGQIRDRLSAAGRDPASFDPAIYIDVLVGDPDETVPEAGAFLEAAYEGRIDSLSRDEIRGWGLMDTADELEVALGEYVDAGVETFVIRSPTLTKKREQLDRLADVMDRL